MVVMVVVSDYLKKLLWVDLNRASYQTQEPPQLLINMFLIIMLKQNYAFHIPVSTHGYKKIGWFMVLTIGSRRAPPFFNFNLRVNYKLRNLEVYLH